MKASVNAKNESIGMEKALNSHARMAKEENVNRLVHCSITRDPVAVPNSAVRASAAMETMTDYHWWH